jgi:hypothetical protein
VCDKMFCVLRLLSGTAGRYSLNGIMRLYLKAVSEGCIWGLSKQGGIGGRRRVVDCSELSGARESKRGATGSSESAQLVQPPCNSPIDRVHEL